MRDVLKTSFEAIGYEVLMPASADLDAEIRRLAPGCDAGLVIAPDHLLAGFTRTLEGACHNVGCGAMNVAVAANKQRSSAILAQHDVPVPAERTRDGAWSSPSGVRRARRAALGRAGGGGRVRPGVHRGRTPLGLARRVPRRRRRLRVLVGRPAARARPEPAGDRGGPGGPVPLPGRRDPDRPPAAGRVPRGRAEGRRGARVPGLRRGRPRPRGPAVRGRREPAGHDLGRRDRRGDAGGDRRRARLRLEGRGAAARSTSRAASGTGPTAR